VLACNCSTANWLLHLSQRLQPLRNLPPPNQLDLRHRHHPTSPHLPRQRNQREPPQLHQASGPHSHPRVRLQHPLALFQLINQLRHRLSALLHPLHSLRALARLIALPVPQRPRRPLLPAMHPLVPTLSSAMCFYYLTALNINSVTFLRS
jgi:hypothetical protein